MTEQEKIEQFKEISDVEKIFADSDKKILKQTKFTRTEITSSDGSKWEVFIQDGAHGILLNNGIVPNI